jgi:O-antigen/teichoic acid export membrane protein
MSLKKQALTGVKWTFLQQLGTQGIGFIISLILARILTPQEFGLIAMIIIITDIGNSLMNAGLGSSLIRSKELNEEDYSTVFYFNLMASIIIYLIIYFSAPYIALFYKQSILTSLVRWLSLILFFNAFASIQQTKLTKNMHFKTLTLISIPSLIVGGIASITMAIYGYGVWSLIGFNLIKSFSNMVLLWHHSKWKPIWKFNKDKFNKHFDFGYKLSLSGLIDGVFNNVYNITIGKFFPTIQVGYYQRAKSMQMYPVGAVSNIIDKVTYPLFAQIQDDNVRLKNNYKKILQINLYILAPILIIAGVLAIPLFRFLFTEKWLTAASYFQILVPAGILYPIHSFNLNILKVKGLSQLLLYLEILKKIIIIIILAITLKYGIYALLYGSLLSTILSFFINSYFSGKYIHYSTFEQIKDILAILILALFAGSVVYFINKNINTNSDFFQILISGTIGIITYIYISAQLKISSFEEIKKFLLTINYLNKKKK